MNTTNSRDAIPIREPSFAKGLLLSWSSVVSIPAIISLIAGPCLAPPNLVSAIAVVLLCGASLTAGVVGCKWILAGVQAEPWWLKLTAIVSLGMSALAMVITIMVSPSGLIEVVGYIFGAGS